MCAQTGYQHIARYEPNTLTSQTRELLIPLDRSAGRLGAQIEALLREAIRSGRFSAQALLPSTRDLAAQLSVSRPLVVAAYEQLAAEGFLQLRQGARPKVAGPFRPVNATPLTPEARLPRYDLAPAVPDLASFPKKQWVKSVRSTLASMASRDIGYGEPQGAPVLRGALADYLSRVRGLALSAENIIITSGFAQGRALACRALAAGGVRHLAVEDPSYSEWEFAREAGLQLIGVPVDEEGLDVDRLERSKAKAVLLTPAHQFPTGAVLSGERRIRLMAWLRSSSAIAVEDDYTRNFATITRRLEPCRDLSLIV